MLLQWSEVCGQRRLTRPQVSPSSQTNSLLLHNGRLRLLQPEPPSTSSGGQRSCPLGKLGVYLPPGRRGCDLLGARLSRGFVLGKEAFNFANALAAPEGAFWKGLPEILRALPKLAIPQLFDLQDRCLPAHTWRDRGGGTELNKNKGVSSQKVAYLCSNSLTPSMVQRSGLLMGREQIGGCHLWFFQGKGGGVPFTDQGWVSEPVCAWV